MWWKKEVTKKKFDWKAELKSTALVLGIGLFIRTFFFQPFVIPSASMYPTLMVRDFLFSSKPYGMTEYSLSLPLIPSLSHFKYGGKKPERGDVIIFTNQKNTKMDFVKRCVGLPGDKIQVKDGVLYINDKPVTLKRVEDYHMVDYKTGQFMVVPQYIETLPNGKEYKIIKALPFGQGHLDNTEVYTVPEGHYFGMGDNRDNSKDSRVLGEVGYIPEHYLIGKAEILFFSTEAAWYQPHLWITSIRFDRLLKWIN